MGNEECSVEECLDKHLKVYYKCENCGALYCDFHAVALDFMCECIIKKNIKKFALK